MMILSFIEGLEKLIHSIKLKSYCAHKFQLSNVDHGGKKGVIIIDNKSIMAFIAGYLLREITVIIMFLSLG